MLMMSLMQMLPGCLCCAAAQDEPVPVILDTDLGDDIDDTWALAMLLGCPEISLKLIVTASDDTPAKTRLVAKILERVGRADIPIGTGAKTSDHPLNQAAWLGDYQLKDYGGEVHEDGIQAMIDFIAASKDPVTLLVIGPQTNLKAALERDPAIAEKARVVTMAGSVDIGYDGKPGRAAEYNVVKDVAAAKVVFAAPWEITMAPLDCCGTLRLSGERYARVASSENPLAKVVMENYGQWANRSHHPANASSVLYDTVAAYLTFNDALLKMKCVDLIVDDEGRTVPDEAGRPVHCGVGWTDLAAFEELLVRSLTATPPGSAD